MVICKLSKLLKLVGSAPGLFRIGVIAAVLNDVGTVPVERGECMMAERTSEHPVELSVNLSSDGMFCHI